MLTQILYALLVMILVWVICGFLHIPYVIAVCLCLLIMLLVGARNANLLGNFS